MIFETHTLPSPLNTYVESVFYFKDFMPDHSIERVVPTGHVFVIFELDNIPRHTYDNETLKPSCTYQKVWVSGVHKNYISISAHEHSEMFVIQFKPYGAYPFLHFPIEELNEKIVPAEEFLSGDLIELRNELLAGSSSQDKFQVAEKWLANRFDETKVPPEELLTFYSELEKTPAVNGHAGNGDYPNTQKHLIDQFKKFVGLTPKYSHRILRFNEILQKIQKEESISWAQIAYQCGFSDQSYFIKEFKHFSGFNPQEFIQQEFDQDAPNFFPLDRKG